MLKRSKLCMSCLQKSFYLSSSPKLLSCRLEPMAASSISHFCSLTNSLNVRANLRRFHQLSSVYLNSKQKLPTCCPEARNLHSNCQSKVVIRVSESHRYSCRRWKSTVYSGSHILPFVGDKWKPGTIPRLDGLDTTRLEEIEDRLFDYLSDHQDKVQISRFIHALKSTGLRETDPRLRECMRMMSRYAGHDSQSFTPTLDREVFKECISQNILLVTSAFRNQFIIPEFGQFCSDIDQLYWAARDNNAGKVATYIPQLARYNPNYWGVALCSVDGQRYSIGDANVPFCLQSVSKPLTYAMALNDLSPQVVHEYVGHEPSGTSFNTISLDYKDKPHNPMINAGAIVVCSLLKQASNLADRFDYVTQTLKRLTGGEYISFNNSVFLSERETADRNFALGYYMREKKCFPEGTNLMEIMDFYFQLCSIEITCDSGAVIAATLANGGICPITGDKVFDAASVRDTMSLMLTCGMYDYSGEFCFKVGLPAKSGVSGGIMIVVPNKMGFFVRSPALDKWGNSCRGVQFAQELVGKFSFHHFDNLRFTKKKTDPCLRHIESRASEIVNLNFSAYNNDVSALRRFVLSGLDMDQSDYDGRTALHIGAAEGHENVVLFLLEKCKCNPFVVDRWGFTPLDDAKRFGRNKVARILELAMANYNAEEKIDRRFQAIDSVKYSEIAFKPDEKLFSEQQLKLNDMEFVDGSDDVDMTRHELNRTSKDSGGYKDVYNFDHVIQDQNASYIDPNETREPCMDIQEEINRRNREPGMDTQEEVNRRNREGEKEK